MSKKIESKMVQVMREFRENIEQKRNNIQTTQVTKIRKNSKISKKN